VRITLRVVRIGNARWGNTVEICPLQRPLRLPLSGKLQFATLPSSQACREHIDPMLLKDAVGRFGKVEEITSAVLFIAGEECSFTIGLGA
jgi:hypothetical protein